MRALARAERGRARPTSRARDAAPSCWSSRRSSSSRCRASAGRSRRAATSPPTSVVYVDFWNGDPVLPWTMVNRTPVAPLVVGGILDLGSPVIVVAFAALLFAGTVLLYARTALRFGRGPAVLVSVALLLFPGFGIVFHEPLRATIVFAAAFAVWTAIAVEAALRPGVSRFALLGAATALLALIRPANQAFLVVGLLPLLLAAPWRVRLSRTVAFGGVAVALLAAWSTVNLVRYDDFTVARGGSASLPLFRAFTSDHIVGPENGPASRTLADAVERELLGEEPYRSYGIDLETFFSEGSHRMHEDLISLSDRVWGWDSDYEHLGEAAWEGGSCAQVDVRPRRARRLLGGALAAALRRTEGARRQRRRRRRPRRRRSRAPTRSRRRPRASRSRPST